MAIRIINADVFDGLKQLEDESVNCVVTSPPYFWARDYGVDGQIGHEQTVVAYIDVIGRVFDEVRRVLRPEGVLWLNLGDSYYSGNGQPKGRDARSPSRDFMRKKLRPLDQSGWSIPKKSLLGIPWLSALELQRRGWTLRSEVIWARKTAFTEASVRDRPHRQHEHVFLFSKSRFYHFDLTALPEQSVWHIEPERSVDGHSAAFPCELAERCIKAGCPDGGTVLDPFGGSGTTGLAADRLGRNAVLIELNSSYCNAAKQRMETSAPLFASVSLETGAPA